MKRVSIDEITGGEILAKDVLSDSGIALMITGTKIKEQYIEKLKGLNINYVYIQEGHELGIQIDEITEMQIKQQCQDKVRETIELYSSYGTNQLDSIVTIAESIIDDVLEQREIIYNICGIREQSESVFAHCVNVCALSVLLAIKMKMPEQKIKDIAIGCLLHDIGISYFKDKYDCTYEECDEELKKEYKKHVIYGYSLINGEGWISNNAKEIVLSHHERMDGSGYPFGLSGRKIKKTVRIVAVCDEFDNLVYQNLKKFKVHEAIDYIVSQADLKFDINVVKTFLDTVAAYPNGSIVTTNRGDRAIVVHQNTKCPTRPVIRLLADRNGVTYGDMAQINLVEDLTLFITDTEL